MALKRSSSRAPRKTTVPDLTGLTRTQAQAAITAAGLVYSESATTGADSGQDQKILSQSSAANQVVLVGDTVPYTYYSYVYGGFGFYGGFYHGFYHGFGFYGGFGFYSAFGFYGGFSFYGGFKFGLNVSSDPWIGVNASIAIEDGYTTAAYIEAGQKVKTIDIKEIAELSSPLELNSTSITVGETSIVDVIKVEDEVIQKMILINSYNYVPTLNILSRKNGVYSFVEAKDISLDHEIYDISLNDWCPVTEREEIVYIDTMKKILCESNKVFIINNLVCFDKLSV